MAFDNQTLTRVYKRTSGYCHLCHAKLSLKNYGQRGQKGAWQVEHSVPRSKGGSDHLNNLFAACVSCNGDKSNKTTRTARGWNGKTRAPLSPQKRKQAKAENGIIGAIGGGALGFAVAGPVGAVIGAITGGHFSATQNPDR